MARPGGTQFRGPGQDPARRSRDGGHPWAFDGHAEQENGEFGRVPLPLPRRGGSNDRHGFRRGCPDHLFLLQGPASDPTLLGHHAKKDPELRQVGSSQASHMQRRKGRRGIHEHCTGERP